MKKNFPGKRVSLSLTITARACFQSVCFEKRWPPTIERVIGLGAASFLPSVNARNVGTLDG